LYVWSLEYVTVRTCGTVVEMWSSLMDVLMMLNEVLLVDKRVFRMDLRIEINGLRSSMIGTRATGIRCGVWRRCLGEWTQRLAGIAINMVRTVFDAATPTIRPPRSHLFTGSIGSFMTERASGVDAGVGRSHRAGATW
jgi:hypothetical protein